METNCSRFDDFALLVDKVAILMLKLRFNAFGWTEMDPEDVNNNIYIGDCVIKLLN